MSSGFRRDEEGSRGPEVRIALGDDGAVTRSAFLRRVAVGAGAGSAVTVAVLGLPRLAVSTPSAGQDREILNFLLTLERTQAAFYAAALQRGSLGGELRQFAQVVSEHERAHVERLRGELGAEAGPAPKLTLDDATADAERVRATAVALEDVALDAYNGQLAESHACAPEDRAADRLRRGAPRGLGARPGARRAGAQCRRPSRRRGADARRTAAHRHPLRGRPVRLPDWLAAIDRDGALTETRTAAVSRAQALRLAAAGGGGLLASRAALPGTARGATRSAAPPTRATSRSSTSR